MCPGFAQISLNRLAAIAPLQLNKVERPVNFRVSLYDSVGYNNAHKMFLKSF